jgi:hypothetical protein
MIRYPNGGIREKQWGVPANAQEAIAKTTAETVSWPA